MHYLLARDYSSSMTASTANIEAQIRRQALHWMVSRMWSR